MIGNFFLSTPFNLSFFSRRKNWFPFSPSFEKECCHFDVPTKRHSRTQRDFSFFSLFYDTAQALDSFFPPPKKDRPIKLDKYSPLFSARKARVFSFSTSKKEDESR